MAIRRGVLDKTYIFEYDVGQWMFGTIQVLKEKESGELRTCKTVPKRLLKTTSGVLARLTALKELRHPYICSVMDALEDNDNFYVIMEFTQGGDIQDWMERMDETNWLQEQTCATYVKQAVLALAHSHAAYAYHRDLRPSNLSLTTKLPDAVIKVSDIGLAAILDPDNSLVQKHPTAYTVPEILKTREPVKSGIVDMWSIGIIAQSLLVGHAPAENLSGKPSSAWKLSRRMPVVEDDGWNDRSDMARDFVQRLLRPASERPTAAKALNHPWLKALTSFGSPNSSADNNVARELRHKTLCYTLGVILLPVIVPYRDFEKLRHAFQQHDPDRDGYIPRAVAQSLLLSRCSLTEAVIPALSIVDIDRVDVLDLCAIACADLIVREFFAAGPTGAPLVGPFRATDLAARMLKRFFDVFGDRRDGAPQAFVSTSALRAKLRTATAREVEFHANVRYDDLISCLPEDRPVDTQILTSQLTAAAGKGTPLSADGGDMSPLKPVNPWGHSFGFDVISIFQSCGVGFRRDESPHSIRIF